MEKLWNGFLLCLECWLIESWISCVAEALEGEKKRNSITRESWQKHISQKEVLVIMRYNSNVVMCSRFTLFVHRRAKGKSFSIKWIFHCIRKNHIIISCSIVVVILTERRVRGCQANRSPTKMRVWFSVIINLCEKDFILSKRYVVIFSSPEWFESFSLALVRSLPGATITNLAQPGKVSIVKRVLQRERESLLSSDENYLTERKSQTRKFFNRLRMREVDWGREGRRAEGIGGKKWE